MRYRCVLVSASHPDPLRCSIVDILTDSIGFILKYVVSPKAPRQHCPCMTELDILYQRISREPDGKGLHSEAHLHRGHIWGGERTLFSIHPRPIHSLSSICLAE